MHGSALIMDAQIPELSVVPLEHQPEGEVCCLIATLSTNAE
jgi:hypothetical protein